MKRFLILATVFAATVPTANADDAPVRAWVAHEGRIKSLEARLATLEAQPRAAQPAPAAALPPAAAVTYEVVSYDGGRSWVTRAVPGTPVFSTPIRDAVYNFVTPTACASGQCPTPRRSYR